MHVEREKNEQGKLLYSNQEKLNFREYLKQVDLHWKQVEIFTQAQRENKLLRTQLQTQMTWEKDSFAVNQLWSKLLNIYANHYTINDMQFISKLSTQLAFSAKWYHNISNGWHFFTVQDIYFYSYVLHLAVWSGLRSEVVLIRHLCVRTYKQAVFVCEINQLQVQQMLVQARSGRHLCFTQVRPKRWHWKRAA